MIHVEDNDEIEKILIEIGNKILAKSLEKIEELFDLIPNLKDPKLLSKKYFWQGRFYKERYGNLDKAFEYLSKVQSFEKNDVFFHAAQLHLATVYMCRQEYESALKYINLIKDYQNADFQLHLGILIAEINWIHLDKREDAIDFWLSVPDKKSNIYKTSQVALLYEAAVYRIQNKDFHKLGKILDTLNLKDLEYDTLLLKRILNNTGAIENILNVYLTVDKIKTELQVKQKIEVEGGFGIFDYCNKFAHYTQSSIAKAILGAGKKNSGSLQLSVADLMNDPTEGKILYNILGQTDWLTHRFNHRRYQAYASCFSFNHDSLNQFRLYGKESGKEATGVSMVFNLGMFSKDDFSNNIVMANAGKLKTKAPQKKHENISKLPLYQCIYYDPKSEYYKLAARSEMTFYRQGMIDGEDPDDIKKKWKRYSDGVADKEQLLKKLFEELKVNLSLVHEYTTTLIADKNKLKQNVINLINDILLPVQFLVKHAAFLEENECRILYIVGAGSDEIKEMQLENGKSRLYIEYEPSVVEYLDKIYLSDGAKEERAFLERAWQQALDRDGITDKSIDIRDSDNPFRI